MRNLPQIFRRHNITQDQQFNFETKVISPVEVTKLLLDRIDAIDPELKSYATVMADEALLEAGKSKQANVYLCSFI